MLALSDMVARAQVIRGLNDARVAVLFVLIGVGATVGSTAGFQDDSVLTGVVWAVGALIVGTSLLTLIHRWSWLRARTMAVMHWITDK